MQKSFPQLDLLITVKTSSYFPFSPAQAIFKPAWEACPAPSQTFSYLLAVCITAKSNLSQFWKLEVWDQGASMGGSSESPIPDL